jgi:hypothetical protein
MGSLGLQDLQWLFYALLAVIVVILGSLIAYVITANRRQRRRMIAAYEADRMAPRPATRVTGQILSLARGEVGGPLQVEIGGRRYSHLAEIEDPQVRRQVVGSALELVQFTGVLDQGAIAPTPISETDSWREDLRENSQSELQRIRAEVSDAASAAEATSGHGEVEEQFLSLLSEMGQPVPPPERPTVMGALRRRRTPNTPKDDSRSFIDDIEDILQRRLRTVPALAGRGLHVQPGEGGLVCFAFEGTEYGSLESIPNLTAQQLVQDAIDEWNERT